MFGMEAQQAMRALVALAGADGPLVLDDLAREAHAPAPALAKILSRLVRLGLVIGQRGPGGGYSLGRAADEIRLVDVITPIQGTSFARTCLFGLPQCSDEAPCPLHSTWGGIRSALIDMIESETLASLVARSPKAAQSRSGARTRAHVAPARTTSTKRRTS